MNNNYPLATLALLASLIAIPGCGGGGSGGGSSSSTSIEATTEAEDSGSPEAETETETETEPETEPEPEPELEPEPETETETETETGNTDPIDITNLILENSSPNCADYAGDYSAAVLDIQRSMAFNGSVTVEQNGDSCTLASNGIPNHDFNDETARFATDVSANTHTFSIPTSPQEARTYTALSQRTYDAVFLNGVVLDLLSAGCYRPNDRSADADGNVQIGCNENSAWLLDPPSPFNGFGTDQNNAHTQPDGRYHYHANPNTLFDDNPGPNGSPVIGFAADGYPVYGSYFLDPDSGQVRKAVSGYALKQGQRPVSAEDPGGSYDGMYIDDYEFTNGGDLDACNGMTINARYGYYVTDAYPWVIGCFRGEVQDSFIKM